MSKLWIGSDLHWAHKNIHKFRCKDKGFYRDFEDETEHREWIKDWWKAHIRKRDTVILLGDVAFKEEALLEIGTMPGRKVLVKGNHDLKKSCYYDKVFDQVHGLLRYKHCWLSHAPVHPQELREKFNIHGHTHHYDIPDSRYTNVCVESLMKIFGTPFIGWTDLVEYRSTLETECKECEYD